MEAINESNGQVKLCKETAEQHIQQMARAWGMLDAKAVISGGKDSSIPPEVRELFLANVMTGDIEIQDNGKKIVQRLHSGISGLDKLVYARKICRHNLKDIQNLPEMEQAGAIAVACADVPEPTLSNLTSRDTATMSAIAVYITFS